MLRYRPFLCPHVIVEAVHGAEVGKGALVALGQGGQLLVVEPEGERLAILADEHVGTLHELGLGDGLQATPNGKKELNYGEKR